MLKVNPGPEREQLGFRDAVVSSFKFLSAFGFHLVREESTFARYESQTVFVNVYHGRASYELGVEIGRLAEAEEKLTIYDVVAWANAEKVEGFGQHTMFQVSSREGVREFVPKLAELVKKYAGLLLRNEPNAYESVKEIRSLWASEGMKQMRLRNVRKEAEVAWHQKDYAQVVELFSSIRDDLSESEAMKLAYAEKQILTPTGVSKSPTRRKNRL